MTRTERAQHHLKSSHACLHRVARLIPPLSLEGVQEAERECKRRRRQAVHGRWELYKAPEQVQVAAGPRILTAHERVEAEGEDISLQTLARLFHPCPDFLCRGSTPISRIALRKVHAEHRLASGIADPDKAFFSFTRM